MISRIDLKCSGGNIAFATTLLLTLWFSGCAELQQTLDAYDNAPVSAPATAVQPVAARAGQGEDGAPLFGLAISGGGSRAAVFTASALEALAELRLEGADANTSVLERVQYLSSVSGGSMAAAYYAVQKPPRREPMLAPNGLTPAYRDFFDQFHVAMKMDFERNKFVSFFSPKGFAESLQSDWEEKFFHRMTFGQLRARELAGDSPVLMLNGTLYNTGRRLAMTTLPREQFRYDFARSLQRVLQSPDVDLSRVQQVLQTQTLQDLNFSYRALPLSVAVAASASVPLLIGPVHLHAHGPEHEHYHVGDGGLFDNLGVESLMEVVLKQLDASPARRALVVMIDAAQPFDIADEAIGKENDLLGLFKRSPSRISDIMEQRAQAYQLVLWKMLLVLRSRRDDVGQVQVVHLHLTDDVWDGYDDLPSACAAEKEFAKLGQGDADVQKMKQRIRQRIANIPTRFQINACNQALVAEAARRTVRRHAPEILGFWAARAPASKRAAAREARSP